MIRLLAVLLIVTAFVMPFPLAYSVETLPLPKLQEEAQVIGVADDPCGEPGQGIVLRVQDTKENVYKLYMYRADKREPRFVLFSTADGDETPAWVGVVRADGNLQAREYMTFGTLTARYPNVCVYFTQKDA